ncbi:MAG: transporter substrate-binding domain-containing protein [Bacteroidota bacterium]|nr:transporter substrate-binding domain-containing protein [Bacteroidota bacterium]
MKKTHLAQIGTGILMLIISLSFFACKDSENRKDKRDKQSKNQSSTHISGDLEAIKKDGKLTALTTFSNTSYFLYRGQPMGFEYELLERFAEHLGVELEIKIANNIDSLLPKIRNGEADILAHGMTITTDRKNKVEFTDYLYLTNQVLVQKKPDNWRNMHWSEIEKSLVHDAIELIGDTISIRKNSSYIKRMANLSSEIGGKIHIDTLPGDISTDEIIKMVAEGEINYTVADDNIASIMASYYPILNIEVPVSFSQRISWAVPPESDSLLAACNNWLTDMKDEVDYYVIYNKYFKNRRSFQRRIESEFYSLNNEKISHYDEMIKSYAENIGWDWRLLASQIYQESQFDPKARSWAGAQGLMQIMPATARELGVSNPYNAEASVRGGTKYLDQLYNRFDEITDSVQRIKFAMASYNCGYGHVLDAQALASYKGYDKDIWDNNVEEMILKLSYPKYYNHQAVKYGYVRGLEPYLYVQHIFKRYAHYKQFLGK